MTEVLERSKVEKLRLAKEAYSSHPDRSFAIADEQRD
jgi:hypothetical protein